MKMPTTVTRILLPALLLLAVGYGGLRAFSFWGTYPPGLPGLGDFQSATWGDGVALPIFAASLLLLRSRLPRNRNFVVEILSWVIGLVAGTVVVLNWLVGDDQALNWTMPQPGVLNPAGIYHAVFLITASGYFMYLVVDAGRRMRTAFRRAEDRAHTRDMLRSGALVVSIASIMAYVFLAFSDSAEVSDSRAGMTSIFALLAIITMIGGGLFWITKGQVRHSLVALMSGLLTAWGFVSLVLYSPQDGVVLSFIIAAVLFGVCVGIDVRYKTNQSSPAFWFELNWAEMLSVGSMSGLFVIAASKTKIENLFGVALLGLLLFLFMGINLVLRRLNRSDPGILADYSWLVVSWIFLATTSGALLVAENDELRPLSTSLFFALLAAALAGPTIKLCKRDFQKVMDMETSEEARSNNDQFTPRQARLSLLIHVRLILCLLATTLAILGLSLLTARQLAWNDNEIGLRVPGFVWAAASFLLIVAITVIVAREFGKRSEPSSSTLRGGSWVVAVISLCIASLLVGGSLLLAALGQGEIHLMATLQALLLSLFAFECVYGNGVRLRLLLPNAGSVLMLMVLALSIFSTIYWSLTVAIGTPEHPVILGHSFVALLGCYGLVALMVLAATTLPTGSMAVPSVRFDKPVLFAAQGMALLLPMWIFAAWIPQTIAAHIPIQQASISRLVMIALVLIGFIALYVSVLLWLAKNNDTHNARYRRNEGLHVPVYFRPEASHFVRFQGLWPRIKESFRANNLGSVSERRARALSSHTGMQNAITFLIASLTILGFFWLIPADLHEGETDDE